MMVVLRELCGLANNSFHECWASIMLILLALALLMGACPQTPALSRLGLRLRADYCNSGRSVRSALWR